MTTFVLSFIAYLLQFFFSCSFLYFCLFISFILWSLSLFMLGAFNFQCLGPIHYQILASFLHSGPCHHLSLIFAYIGLYHVIIIFYHMLHILPFPAPNFNICLSQMYPFSLFCHCILPDFPFMTLNFTISLSLLTHLSPYIT